MRSRSYRRPSRAKPREGWTLSEFASLAGVSHRLVGLYIREGLVKAPKFAARGTRYERAQLVELIVARAFRERERLGLSAIKLRMGAMSAAELEAVALEAVAHKPTLAAAIGVRTQAAAPPAPAVARPPIGAERWDRVVLFPGVELHVRGDASDAALSLVEKLRVHCVSLLESSASG
ncbi:MAG: MerR family transcriptional regulator [Polyangiaceae bacterium]